MLILVKIGGNLESIATFRLTYHILSTAGGFMKIAGKGGGVEYLILNFYLSSGYVKSNVNRYGI